MLLPAPPPDSLSTPPQPRSTVMHSCATALFRQRASSSSPASALFVLDTRPPGSNTTEARPRNKRAYCTRTPQTHTQRTQHAHASATSTAGPNNRTNKALDPQNGPFRGARGGVPSNPLQPHEPARATLEALPARGALQHAGGTYLHYLVLSPQELFKGTYGIDLRLKQQLSPSRYKSS